MNLSYRDVLYIIAFLFLGFSIALISKGLSGYATTLSITEAIKIFEIQQGLGSLICFFIIKLTRSTLYSNFVEYSILMNFKEQLIDFKTNFDNQLSIFLLNKIQQAAHINPTAEINLKEIYRVILEVKSAGKRIRPALTYFGFLASGKAPNKQEMETIIQVGIALELFHTFALIHDDIIDESLTRRGSPTVQSFYQDYFKQDLLDNHPSLHQNLDDRANHFALGATILAGDFAYMLSQEVIGKLPSSPAVDAMKTLFYQMQFELISGQLDDCYGVGMADFDTLDPANIEHMLILKSGNYSIQKPLLLGATLAGASDSQIASFNIAGEKIGLVYQLTDDIISLFGDENKTGKPSKADIVEGKRTLMMSTYYNQLNDEERLILKEQLGNANIANSEIDQLKQKMIESGVVDQIKDRCQKENAEALDIIYSSFDKDNDGITFIRDMSAYLIARDS